MSIETLLKLYKFFWLSFFPCLCSCFFYTNKQEVLLKVGSQTWSFQEVQDYMELRISDFTAEQKPKDLKQKLLKEILFMALLEDWLKEQKIDSKKILLKKEEQSLFQKDLEKLKAFKRFKKFLFLKQNLMQFLEEQIPDPSLKEQKAFYQKNKVRFQTQAQCQLDQILVKEEQLAQSLYERIKNGESFASLAKRYSKQTRLGWVKKTEFPFFDPVCLNSSLQKPLKSRFGYHLFLRTDFKRAGKKSFSESQKQILKLLKNQKVPSEFQKWLKSQSEQKNIWIDKKGLEKIKIQYK